MMEFKFTGFDVNIIEEIVKFHNTENTAIFFPSNKSRNIAMSVLQKISGFKKIDLYTLEDINKLALLSDKPLLNDVKRTLLFFLSIPDDLKKAYNLTDYFGASKFLNQVLTLFQELNEELVDYRIIEDKLLSEGYFADWQKAYWNDLLVMRRRYQEYLESISYTDTIFVSHNLNCLDIFFEGYENIVFANQFYLTNVEKRIISYIDNHDKHIYMWYQCLEGLFNKEDLSFNDFSLKDLIGSSGKCHNKFYIYNCPNEFSMLMQGITTIEEKKIKNLVDFDFYENDWFNYLSNSKFSLPQSYLSEKSEIHNFLKTVLNLLDSLVYVKESQNFMIPLKKVFEAFNYSYFREYFISNETENINNRVKLVFRQLAQKNFLYFDKTCLDLIQDEEVLNAFKGFYDLLNSLLQIKSLNELINLFEVNEGIFISKIINHNNLKYTDILENFYEALSNLSTIEDFGIINNWSDIFGRKPIIVSLLKFLIDNIKDSLISFKSETQGEIVFNTLVDTRNLFYDKILYFHLIEGVLPKSKAIDFMFTESQRKMLGLKTYNDIRQREKYYFFRNILNTQENHLFCIENEDENIERSSFVEELLIYLKDNCLEYHCVDEGYSDFFKAITKQKSDYLINYNRDLSKLSDLDFYLIPSDFQTDFGVEKQITLSTYSLAELINDPMQWFIRYNLKFNNYLQPEEDRLNPKNIGILTHQFIESIYLKQVKKYSNLLKYKQLLEAINEDNLNEVYNDLIQNKFLLKFPHDFSGKYFHNIIFPVVRNNIITFFRDKSLADISKNSIVLMERLLPKVKLLQVEGIDIFLTGKPDLLIQDKEKFYIIDFKTGKLQKSQLILYKYLIQQNFESVSELEFSLYFLSLIKYEKLNQNQLGKNNIEEIIERLEKTLKLINSYGYFYPESKTKQISFSEISRIDIFRKDRPDFWKIVD